MSLFGGVANYGGKQPDNSQGIKQFVEGPSGQASWVYKRLPNGLQVQTPADKIRPVYINTDLYVNGSIYNPSDIILKKNIEPISSEKITSFNNLEPVQYSFKNDNKNKVHYGFIAQDVEKIYPELVKNSEMGYKTINYIELIPFLVQKLNDNAKEIELLKFKIQELSDNGK
jgi:hypothetical protein